MDRREAISKVALLLGGTVIGSGLFLSGGCSSDQKKVALLFDAESMKLLDEIADTILPETKTPGAKAAKVGAFMALMVKDCYSDSDQKVFTDGLTKLQHDFKNKYRTDFLIADASHRTDFLSALDVEQKNYMQKKEATEVSHYFRMMKELTLLGYFSSEIGSTQALRYLPIPGKYDGNYPYKKGDRAWAT